MYEFPAPSKHPLRPEQMARVVVRAGGAPGLCSAMGRYLPGHRSLKLLYILLARGHLPASRLRFTRRRPLQPGLDYWLSVVPGCSVSSGGG